MRILADEDLEAAMVQWLRATGHEVLWAAEDLAATPDPELLKISRDSSLVLMTRDRDFGELVFRERLGFHGIVLLRIRARNQWERLALLQPFWPAIEARAAGHFIVVTKDRLRIRAMPNG